MAIGKAGVCRSFSFMQGTTILKTKRTGAGIV